VVALATTVGAVLETGAVLPTATSCAAGPVAGATAAGGGAVATGCSFLVAGAMLMFTAGTGGAPAPAGDAAEVPPVTLAIPNPLFAEALAVFEAVVEPSAFGTAPLPGVPMPGNTLPACKLPSLGWAADGLAAEALGAGCAVAGFSL
jgi:hypothetical protein